VGVLARGWAVLRMRRLCVLRMLRARWPVWKERLWTGRSVWSVRVGE